MITSFFKIQHLIYFVLAIIIFCISCKPQSSEIKNDSSPTPPNIVVILTDDVGWNEFGFNNDHLKLTPHIDRLRSEGVSLTQFYVHAVCAPTRTALLTGRYPFRNWTDWRTEDFGKPSYLEKLGMSLVKNEDGDDTRRIHALPTEERTIAEALTDAGYFTAITGKWGCGEWLPEHLPMGQGFQYQYGHYAWGIDYNNYTIPHNAPARFAVYDWHRNQKPIKPEGYATDLIAQEVVTLLDNHHQNNDQRPFFIYVPFNAVHGPLEETPRYATLGKRYAALKCLDDAVGKITKSIDKNGYSQNTIVVLANDNGAIRDSMNAPYRGTKNTNYEGGVRVPCIIKYPENIEPGSTYPGLMHVTDIYPTMLSMAGVEYRTELQMDGIDMSNAILQNETELRKEIVFEVSGSVRLPSMRSGDYKLIGKELYNIFEDPSEMTNLYDSMPELVKDLELRLEQIGLTRPPMPDFEELMTPALPWVYGQMENSNVPDWLKDHVSKIRDTQPKQWADGATPWPQAPKDGKIIYTGDGR